MIESLKKEKLPIFSKDKTKKVFKNQYGTHGSWNDNLKYCFGKPEIAFKKKSLWRFLKIVFEDLFKFKIISSTFFWSFEVIVSIFSSSKISLKGIHLLIFKKKIKKNF